MGFLLKIAALAMFAYVVWTTAKRWMGLFGLNRPSQPPPAASGRYGRGTCLHRPQPGRSFLRRVVGRLKQDETAGPA